MLYIFAFCILTNERFYDIIYQNGGAVMELNKLEQSFKLNHFNTEDDIKIHFHSDIVKPLLEKVNPMMASQYRSDHDPRYARYDPVPYRGQAVRQRLQPVQGCG